MFWKIILRPGYTLEGGFGPASLDAPENVVTSDLAQVHFLRLKMSKEQAWSCPFFDHSVSRTGS